MSLSLVVWQNAIVSKNGWHVVRIGLGTHKSSTSSVESSGLLHSRAFTISNGKSHGSHRHFRLAASRGSCEKSTIVRIMRAGMNPCTCHRHRQDCRWICRDAVLVTLSTGVTRMLPQTVFDCFAKRFGGWIYGLASPTYLSKSPARSYAVYSQVFPEWLYL